VREVDPGGRRELVGSFGGLNDEQRVPDGDEACPETHLD
jgi:hypothetical protein